MLEKFSSEMIQRAINEFNKEENQIKIKENIIDPIVYYILDRLSPYIIVMFIIFVLIFLIAITILLMMIRNSWKK
jgi:hypothetical protein